jgi:hypothetical protein
MVPMSVLTCTFGICRQGVVDRAEVGRGAFGAQLTAAPVLAATHTHLHSYYPTGLHRSRHDMIADNFRIIIRFREKFRYFLNFSSAFFAKSEKNFAKISS